MYTLTRQMCLALVFVLTLCSCAKDNDQTDKSSEITTPELLDLIAYSAMEAEILKGINDYRISKGLAVLKKADVISTLAANHNKYMIEQKIVSHENFSYRYNSLVNTIEAKSVSENIAFGYRASDAVINAWISSEEHRSNLEGNFSHFGISVLQDENGENYFTNIFARR